MCNIVFDFISPHNGEYWYTCTECGASDWFNYAYKPAKSESINGCNLDPMHQKTYIDRQKLLDELRGMSLGKLADLVISLREKVIELESWVDDAYSVHSNIDLEIEQLRQSKDKQ